MLLGRTKSELQRRGLHAKKGLGQNFLVDEHALSKIVSAADITHDDLVVEVGPGLGVLTKELAQNAGRVIAVELDTAMAAALKEMFVGSPHVAIVEADILGWSPESFIPDDIHYKVVGALPYNIASAVLRHFLESKHKPALIVAVMQKEVAQSVAAQPGDMSILSVGVQLYGRPSIIGYIPPTGFYPPPKVDSAIVRIDVYNKPAVDVEDEVVFFDVVRGGFSTPRKQLRNSLAYGLDITATEAGDLLAIAAIDPRRRAETLALEEWAALYRAFAGRI
jgi:16S rRNA (adenine1518-N6/adenine1519-N6)-dimethyltransferase